MFLNRAVHILFTKPRTTSKFIVIQSLAFRLVCNIYGLEWILVQEKSMIKSHTGNTSHTVIRPQFKIPCVMGTRDWVPETDIDTYIFFLINSLIDVSYTSGQTVDTYHLSFYTKVVTNGH